MATVLSNLANCETTRSFSLLEASFPRGPHGRGAALGSCHMPQGSPTRGSTGVHERAYSLTAVEVLTIFLNIYYFLTYSVFAPSPWLVPSCFTQNKHGHELRGHWDPPLRQPPWKLGALPAPGVGGGGWVTQLVAVAHIVHPDGLGRAPAGPGLRCV